ncbi:MAG: DNA replication/repair protein RecF [Chlorobiaceae bacterium]|nr:DNA replication/repair protein RecF [Chlorobiaceae bacterium]
MQLESLSIANFRNHKLLEFDPCSSITNIYGRNGSGKTTILESIHYCALTKGFNGSSDRECMMFGEEMFTLRSSFRNNFGNVTRVVVAYSEKNGKKIVVNDHDIPTFSGHIGTIPCVSFTPREMVIITGSPSERRRFIDTAICQHDRKYLSDLMQYRRVLQQRNALLASFVDNVAKQTSMEILTEQIVLYTVEIVKARMCFIERFRSMFKEFYASIQDGIQPEVVYHPSIDASNTILSGEDLFRYIKERYQVMSKQEIQRKQTIVGPHRDDIHFFINGKEIRKFASQGQQRTFLVAMKMTMHRYLHEYSGEIPITLMDDLFSELDDKVSEKMLQSLSTKGQVIITSTKAWDREDVINYYIEK